MKKVEAMTDYPLFQNMDGQIFYNEMKGEFTLGFNTEQKEVLLRGLEQHLPVQAVAYPSVPSSCMAAIMEFMCPEQTDWAFQGLYRIDYWKTAMVYKKPEECTWVLAAMRSGVNVFKEFKDVRKYDDSILELIWASAENGVNICKYVRKEWPLEQLKTIATKKVKAKMRKEVISDFFYFLKNPEGKKIFLNN